MSSSESRNNILKKIRTALEQPTPLPFPKVESITGIPIQPLQQDLVVEFAEQFTQLQGKFIFCANRDELKENFDKLCYQNQWTKIYCAEDEIRNEIKLESWDNDIASSEASITGCEALVARTGSMILSSAANRRVPSVYAPIHICLAYSNQLVYDVADAIIKVKEKYKNSLPSFITLATGPSRTADIEKTLVVGVHGPKEVYCFLIDEAPLSPDGGT